MGTLLNLWPPTIRLEALVFLAGETGFEPATYGFGRFNMPVIRLFGATENRSADIDIAKFFYLLYPFI